MSERLIIRLGIDDASPCSWLIWSAATNDVIASGVLAKPSELATLSEHAANRPVDVLVSSAGLTLTQVNLPVKGQRQALKALPFMLEENLAGNVDDMHFVPSERDGDLLGVIAVSHQQMQAWLAWLADAQITPSVMLADCLCLPAVDGCDWSAMAFDDDIMLRLNGGLGYLLPKSWLLLALTQLTATLPTPPVVACFTEMDLPATDIRMQPLELPMQVLVSGISSAKGNLLSGHYQPKKHYSAALRPWLPVAALVLLALVLSLVDKGVAIYRINQETQVVQQQVQSIFTTMVPGSRRIVNLRNQLGAELRKLQGQGSGGQLFVMLAELEPVFKAVPSLKPNGLRFDSQRSELRLQVTADSFEQIEKFRELASKDFKVEAGAMNSAEQSVNSTLILRSI
ncbi:type II secretion system protein GspL [Shewanella sp. NIFS-20-20]|uniref:type II secretion system protein GspL n=1 Tax=Shewanella sp. NIFS-20-20 TaxID=2853806 RepID=UPI001C49371C|nr:type II secretion system protein GspL [Shewanella sp. NIFS-20-20]